MFRRSLRKQLTCRSFTISAVRNADFTHAVSEFWKTLMSIADKVKVIGGGAVGLAIARKLAAREGSSTLLIERNEAVGMETSSRNSEVPSISQSFKDFSQ